MSVPTPMNQRFLPCHRIRRPADFQRAFRRRASAADPAIVVYGHPNDLPHARLGLSVSRKVGPAVLRNRWKRLLREAFRLSRHELPVGIDLVVIPRVATEPSLASLIESLKAVAERVRRKLAR